MIELGVAAGAEVIAIAGGAEKVRLVRGTRRRPPSTTRRQEIFDEAIARTDGKGPMSPSTLSGGEQTETIWTCMAREGRYLPIGFNDDPQSGLTGRSLVKISMGNISVLGVILGTASFLSTSADSASTCSPWSLVARSMPRCSDLLAEGSIRPVIGRRIAMDEVAGALEDHGQRRTRGELS